MEFNVQLQLAGLLEWMAQQMTACRGKTAVIGISGGKDSSTVAALAVAAYGRENVMGVLMPDGVQPDIDYSQALVETLRIPHVTLNIHDAVQGVVAELEKAIRGIAKAAPIRNLLLKCGVYCCENASLPVSVICNRAFLALNSIKDDMNHAVARFDDPINQRICRERDMEARFEDALQNQEFVVWYQPKFDVRTERMVGAEALVRWRKQDGTVVSPGEFIPLFERDGLIIRLDEFVFRSVCRIQKKLLAQFGSVFPISVNLSQNSLHYPGMIERYARIVAEEELEAKCVPIELTESAEQQMIQIKDLAQKMVELGFPLHMDDFGAGYSSLGNLNALPFHVLKLDKSLVDYIGNYRGNQVLQHIISLAHSLGMDILAEGVETQEQVQFLREVGCDYIQGYYYSKPLPEQTFLDNVARWHESGDDCGLQIKRALRV